MPWRPFGGQQGDLLRLLYTEIQRVQEFQHRNHTLEKVPQAWACINWSRGGSTGMARLVCCNSEALSVKIQPLQSSRHVKIPALWLPSPHLTVMRRHENRTLRTVPAAWSELQTTETFFHLPHSCPLVSELKVVILICVHSSLQEWQWGPKIINSTCPN